MVYYVLLYVCLSLSLSVYPFPFLYFFLSFSPSLRFPVVAMFLSLRLDRDIFLLFSSISYF